MKKADTGLKWVQTHPWYHVKVTNSLKRFSCLKVGPPVVQVRHWIVNITRFLSNITRGDCFCTCTNLLLAFLCWAVGVLPEANSSRWGVTPADVTECKLAVTSLCQLQPRYTAWTYVWPHSKTYLLISFIVWTGLQVAKWIILSICIRLNEHSMCYTF